MPSFVRPLIAALAALAVAVPAWAASPGLDAIREFKNPEEQRRPAIQNRFFLKEGRFEITPGGGYVPNNPFVKRYVGGLLLAYHFREELAAEGSFYYSPDLGLNDLKGLTKTLVAIAQTGTGDSNFQQPLDKVTLGASFGARWTPVYGKINLVGETVLNFDFYGVGALGLITKKNYAAVYNKSSTDPNNPVQLVDNGNEFEVTPVLGVGMNFFLNQTIALKLDARMALFVDEIPDYDSEPDVNDNQQRLYNNFTTTAGVAFYFPRMRPRLYNF